MITDRQHEIYNNLMHLVNTNESFYFVDQVLEGIIYRVFSYRLSSYSDFLLPDAKEARGIMFEIDEHQYPVRIACRCPHKFFNLHENPFTMGLDTSSENVALVMDKVDGSLISAFLHNGEVRLKSKTSVSSDQVLMATKYLKQNPLLEFKIYETSVAGKTVNMEFSSPDNRIVIGYMEPKLTVLSVRDNETGEYDQSLYTGSRFDFFRVLVLGQEYGFEGDLFKSITGIEGVVVVLKTGEWFKVKTPWYAALHKTKDSINSKKKLFEAIVCETADDLKSLFFDDPLAMSLITEMEQKVLPMLRGFIAMVDAYYINNKDLDKKSYAIKGQQYFARELFGVAMNKYLGREIDWKEWAVKHIDLFGVKDEPTPLAVEE